MVAPEREIPQPDQDATIDRRRHREAAAPNPVASLAQGDQLARRVPRHPAARKLGSTLRTSGLHLASAPTQASIMNNGFTVFLMVLGIAVSARAYTQDFALLALKAQVFSEPLCENLPEVRPELKTWVDILFLTRRFAPWPGPSCWTSWPSS